MLEVVWGLNITWKSGAIWKSAPIQNMLRKCPFKHLQKLNENVGIVTITLQKRTTITGIVRTFTQNKFPIRNLSQSSAHD